MDIYCLRCVQCTGVLLFCAVVFQTKIVGVKTFEVKSNELDTHRPGKSQESLLNFFRNFDNDYHVLNHQTKNAQAHRQVSTSTAHRLVNTAAAMFRILLNCSLSTGRNLVDKRERGDGIFTARQRASVTSQRTAASAAAHAAPKLPTKHDSSQSQASALESAASDASAPADKRKGTMMSFNCTSFCEKCRERGIPRRDSELCHVHCRRGFGFAYHACLSLMLADFADRSELLQLRDDAAAMDESTAVDDVMA